MFKQVDHRNLPSANTRWPNRWFFTSRREYYELAVKQAEAAYDIVQLLSFRMIPSWGLLNEGYLSFAKIRVADFLDSFLATVSLIFLQQSSNFLKTFLCIEILRLKIILVKAPDILQTSEKLHGQFDEIQNLKIFSALWIIFDLAAFG